LFLMRVIIAEALSLSIGWAAPTRRARVSLNGQAPPLLYGQWLPHAIGDAADALDS